MFFHAPVFLLVDFDIADEMAEEETESVQGW
jgi:hypothetical protein